MTNVWCDINGRFVVFSHANQNSTWDTINLYYACDVNLFIYFILQILPLNTIHRLSGLHRKVEQK
jgi:hypothetical protein